MSSSNSSSSTVVLTFLDDLTVRIGDQFEFASRSRSCEKYSTRQSESKINKLHKLSIH